jgi:hypothetical protein
MNSAVGILENLRTGDFGDLTQQATDIQQKLADPKNLELLRDVLTKLD